MGEHDVAAHSSPRTHSPRVCTHWLQVQDTAALQTTIKRTKSDTFVTNGCRCWTWWCGSRSSCCTSRPRCRCVSVLETFLKEE